MSRPSETLERILADAVEIPSAAERQAFVEQACGNDVTLRARVEELVAHHFNADGFLERPVAVQEPATLPRAVDSGTQSIGPYTLREPLGEGGMGLVYVAEQQQPVRRLVALKVIKPGMESKQVVARFEAERQALALMDHPNIAKVLDAGTTDDGLPFFVMELIRGLPVTQSCDQARLTVRQRLELFAQVCRAVQHAHTKGVIHRDLKPGNVLVTSHDGFPVPVVIDFGVAKALGGRLTDHTIYTGFHAVVGTPLYMSPEQVEFNQFGVDTRSDVYALGVLLYELLTGTTPIDRERLKTAGYDEFRRILREEEPPRPSSRLSTAEAAHTTASARRCADAGTLTRTLHGELDWIVLKALEKDRNRRYQSAGEFAADVDRYLTNEPVVAHPPSAWYRARKFARRNRRGVLSIAAVLVALLAGAGISVWQAIRATHAEAITAGERESARKEAATAREVNSFLRILLDSANPEFEPDRDIKLRVVLDRAATLITGPSFPEQPLVEADVRDTVGHAYYSLGEYPKAAEQFERALEVRRHELPPDHQDTLGAMHNLALAREGQGQLTDAEQTLGRLLEIQTRVLPENDPDTLATLQALAGVELKLGKIDDAETRANRVHEIRMRQLGPDDLTTLSSKHLIASILRQRGAYDKAAAAHREVLDARVRVLGPNHPSALASMNDLAVALQSQKKSAEADRLLADLLERKKAVYGAEHPATLKTMNNLAVSLMRQDKCHEAEVLLREVVRLKSQVLGPEDESTIGSLQNVAVMVDRQGRHREAAKLFHEVLEVEKRVMGADHVETLGTIHNLGISLTDLGEHAEAAKLFRELLDTLKRVRGPRHPETALSMNELAWLLATSKDPKVVNVKQAVELAKQAVDIVPSDASFRNTLGVAHYRAGDWADAAVALEKSVQLSDGGDESDWVYLAMSYWRCGKPSEARGWLEKASAARRKAREPDSEKDQLLSEAVRLIAPPEKK